MERQLNHEGIEIPHDGEDFWQQNEPALLQLAAQKLKENELPSDQELIECLRDCVIAEIDRAFAQGRKPDVDIHSYYTVANTMQIARRAMQEACSSIIVDRTRAAEKMEALEGIVGNRLPRVRPKQRRDKKTENKMR